MIIRMIPREHLQPRSGEDGAAVPPPAPIGLMLALRRVWKSVRRLAVSGFSLHARKIRNPYPRPSAYWGEADTPWQMQDLAS